MFSVVLENAGILTVVLE